MRLQLRTSLRNKTLVIVLVAVVGLVGGLFIVSRAVLLGSFSRLEEAFAVENLGRVSSALSNEIDTLQHTTDRFADSDQTYEYLTGVNPDSVRAEFPARTFEQLRVNFIVVLDRSGHKVFSRGFNVASMSYAPVPPDLDRYLTQGSLLFSTPNDTSDVTGIVMLASGPVLIDSSSILTSNSDGPSAGRLIMGRLLDADETVRLAEMTHLLIEIQRIDSPNLPADFRDAAAAMTPDEPHLIHSDGADSLAAYENLHDIHGKPVAILRVLLPRKIYDQGRTSLLQFLLLLLAAGAAFGSVTMYLLERFVISRVGKLSDDITQIGASGDMGRRVGVSGRDELANLGDTINGMLEDLERVQFERHQERARLAVMIEKMPAILWTADTELKVTSAAGAGLESLGLRSREPHRTRTHGFLLDGG